MSQNVALVGVQMIDRRNTTFRNPSNQTAITAVNAFAKLLAARYSPIVGATRSWDGSNFQVCFLMLWA